MINGQPMHPLQRETWREALQSHLEELREELAQYEALHPEACIPQDTPEFAELESQTVHA